MFPTVARASLIVCLSAVIYAQTESTRPAFEVVSVKPTPPERLNLLKVERCKEGGPFITEGAPLLWTIEYAYRLNDSDLAGWPPWVESFADAYRSEEHTSELQSLRHLVCRLLLEKKNTT